MKIIKSDNSIYEKIEAEFGKEKADLLHFKNGFTFTAFDSAKIVGFASVKYQKLPYVFKKVMESYIDVIEVKKEYRRQGIARKLLGFIEKESRKTKVRQIRAWSSKDKKEAIIMWQKLGFGLHPEKVISMVTKKPVKGYFVVKVLN